MVRISTSSSRFFENFLVCSRAMSATRIVIHRIVTLEMFQSQIKCIRSSMWYFALIRQCFVDSLWNFFAALPVWSPYKRDRWLGSCQCNRYETLIFLLMECKWMALPYSLCVGLTISVNRYSDEAQKLEDNQPGTVNLQIMLLGLNCGLWSTTLNCKILQKCSIADSGLPTKSLQTSLKHRFTVGSVLLVYKAYRL